MKNARFRNHRGFWAFALMAGLAAAACGDDDHTHAGKASGAVCPSGSTLTYATFGQNFMTKYCTGCHSTTVMGDARKGAPADHNFDTLRSILQFADHIDEHAAAGPNSVNTDMPPAETMNKPTDDERKQLGEWLACETADDDAGGTDGGRGDTGTGDSSTGDGSTGDTGSRGDSGGMRDMGRGEIVSDSRGGG